VVWSVSYGAGYCGAGRERDQPLPCGAAVEDLYGDEHDDFHDDCDRDAHYECVVAFHGNGPGFIGFRAGQPRDLRGVGDTRDQLRES